MALKNTLHRVFCQNLRAIRKARGLTQVEMAERMASTQPAYSDLENGRCAPTLTTLERVATALSVTPEELLAAKKVAAVA